MYKALVKMRNKKGFTLMELLIVVAIIAILAAIAIPTFSSSLTKAKAAADEANARSLYAAVAMEYMTTGTFTAPTGSGTALEFDSVKYTFNTAPTVTGGGATDTSWSISVPDPKGGTALVWTLDYAA